MEKETSEPWFVDLTITNLDHGGKTDAKFKMIPVLMSMSLTNSNGYLLVDLNCHKDESI